MTILSCWCQLLFLVLLSPASLVILAADTSMLQSQNVRNEQQQQQQQQQQNQPSSPSPTTSTTSSNTCVSPPLTVPPSWNVFQIPSSIIIAHRGASANLPEHTLEAYRLALALGANYIEPDLVPTRDGHLIAMHSLDLNITTNVATVFPGRETFSPYLNETDATTATAAVGFWSFNFDLNEIQQLRVKQRLPKARSKAFDGLFGIPTLTEILQLVQDWNNNIQPLLVMGESNQTGTTTTTTTTSQSHRHHRGAGVYAEIKEYAWTKRDTGMDVVDLLFRHMDENADLWQTSIFNRMCTVNVDIGANGLEFELPPLFIQAFEPLSLQLFRRKWLALQASSQVLHYQNTGENDQEASSTVVPTAAVDQPPTHLAVLDGLPIPPTILLLDNDDCHNESFWSNLNGVYRDIVDGLGPNKNCLDLLQGPNFMERAAKLDLVVHPWTTRPEQEFRLSPEMESEFDELFYLLCDLRVHGVFSESVATAVRASNSCPCPQDYHLSTCPHQHSDDFNFVNSPAEPLSCCIHDSRIAMYSKEATPTLFVVLFGSLGIFLALSIIRRCDRISILKSLRSGQQLPTVEISEESVEML